MADNTILISVVDATGCVLRVYQMDTEGSMKQLINHFKDYACPLCTNAANITFWYQDIQITTIHTPSTLDLPPLTKITIKPSILCATTTTTRGETLPVLHHFSLPFVRLHGGTFTPSPLGGEVSPFAPFDLTGQQDREQGWGRREALRADLLNLKKQEKDLIRKIVVGSVYEKYAVNGDSVREGIERAVGDRERVEERVRAVEVELEREGRRDSVWVT